MSGTERNPGKGMLWLNHQAKTSNKKMIQSDDISCNNIFPIKQKHAFISQHYPVAPATDHCSGVLSSGAPEAPGNLVKHAYPGLILKVSESVELGVSPELVRLTSSLG